MIEAFTKKNLDSPRLMAELLVAHVIGCDRIRLYMDADRPASPLEREQLRDLVGRALKNEPVQYLVGEGWFFGLPFHVDKRVLIPRPATETIVEQVLLHARAEPGFGGKTGEGVRFADIGTGSGAIAVSLLKNLPQAAGIATDVSEAALEVAKRNAERHKVADRLEFLQGDLVRPLIEHPAGTGRDLHYIVSNPPYIPDDEWNAPDMVDRNVRDFEPESALRGGPDGLNFLHPIIQQAPDRLRPGGLLILETAAATAKTVAELMKNQPLISPESVRVVRDFEGYDRVVVGARKS
jgi:release factor glutamine methyltransferase